MPHFIPALIGPRLYWHYGRGRSYEPNFLESSGDKMITLGNCIYNTACMLSFIVLPYIVSTWTPSGYGAAVKAAATFYLIAYSLRTTGRMTNSDYKQFIIELERAKAQTQNLELRRALKSYDFQVAAAPPDFIARPAKGKWFYRIQHGEIKEMTEPFNSIRGILAWIAANTIGRRMVYPGSLAFLQSILNAQLIEGRRKLIQEKEAERNIVQTEEGDKLDTIFVDNRGRGNHGDTLIICCDGNAGYYEIGVMKTPMELGYSVLAWNMPGFAESSGTPYPNSLLLSMEAIMQFAIQKIGFIPKNIVLYAWSIGGFPATWAAANYPQIHALILDASFDDLVPLAVARMPEAVSGLTSYAIKKHLNLPISKQLNRYQGPVLLIRRWDEEIIVTDQTNEHTRRASNRGNWLLLRLLEQRYPGLINSNEDRRCLFDWLAKEPQSRLTDYPPEDSNEPAIPLNADFNALEETQRKRLIHQLCNKYFVDYMYASHNAPLKPDYFNIPQQIG